jgi:hypothetical protein
MDSGDLYSINQYNIYTPTLKKRNNKKVFAISTREASQIGSMELNRRLSYAGFDFGKYIEKQFDKQQDRLIFSQDCFEIINEGHPYYYNKIPIPLDNEIISNMQELGNKMFNSPAPNLNPEEQLLWKMNPEWNSPPGFDNPKDNSIKNEFKDYMKYLDKVIAGQATKAPEPEPPKPPVNNLKLFHDIEI